jgi:hypothetical protein
MILSRGMMLFIGTRFSALRKVRTIRGCLGPSTHDILEDDDNPVGHNHYPPREQLYDRYCSNKHTPVRQPDRLLNQDWRIH